MSWEAVRERRAEAAVVLDFDGTLAPIVERPEAARPVDGAAQALRELVNYVRSVHIVTGRPSTFVRAVLDVPDIEIVGLYGRQDAPPLDDDVLRDVAAIAASEPGASVEHKGAAVAVHVRLAPDPVAAADRMRPDLTDIAAAHGLELLEGKRVLELAPVGADKGTVVADIAKRAFVDAVLYAGDDISDLRAFDALDSLEASGLAVCRVAVLGPEVPADLATRADVQVEDPAELLALLASL